MQPSTADTTGIAMFKLQNVAIRDLGSRAKTEAPRHFANLDLLRSVAVGLVFIDHLMETAKIRLFGALGHFGVLLFFVHTAFVLMLSLESIGLWGSNLYSAFLIRRFFRIYPLSILTVLTAVAFEIPSTAWLGGYASASWKVLLSNVFLIQNAIQTKSIICVLWSLPFELQMYAVLPAIYLLISRSRWRATAWLAWLAAIVVAALEYLVRSGKCDPEFLLTRYFPCFLAGVLAWQLMKTRKTRLPGWMWVLCVAGLVATYRIVDAFRIYGPGLFAALHGNLRSDHVVWWPPTFDLLNDWVFCAITGLALPHFAGITAIWLNVITKRIAQYSYGVYLSHVPVLWLCFKRIHFASVQMSVIVSLVLTAILSVVFYHWLEYPAIGLGKRLARKCEGNIALA